jgi:hypothetical protein
MKKKLNEAAISNELRQGSVYFRANFSPPAIAPEKRVSPIASGAKVERPESLEETINVRSNERTVERTNERLQEPRDKRLQIRHTFDIFADQLQALHTLQLKAVQAGRSKPNLGTMVKKAIDMYLEKEEHKKPKRTNERSNERTLQRTNKFDNPASI